MGLERGSVGATREGAWTDGVFTRGLPSPLPPLRCRGGKPEASAPSAPASAGRRRSGGDRAQCSRDAPRWGGAPRGPVALRSRCSDVACLRGWRREAEELGDHGFGGAQHRGDQRRQVEVALAGGAYDAGQDLLGVGAVAGAVATAHLADDHGRPDGLFGAPVGASSEGSHKKRNTAGNSVARCAAKRSASSSGGGASTSRPSRAVSRPRRASR